MILVPLLRCVLTLKTRASPPVDPAPQSIPSTAYSQFPNDDELLEQTLRNGLPELFVGGKPVAVGSWLWLHRSVRWHPAQVVLHGDEMKLALRVVSEHWLPGSCGVLLDPNALDCVAVRRHPT